MPKPETKKTKPDFLQMHCTNTDLKQCSSCARDFVLPVNTIATITKSDEGLAVFQTGDHAFFHPLCGAFNRSIKTLVPFQDVVDMLDGKIQPVGDVEMTYYKETIV